MEIEPPTRADRDNEIELATKNANSRDAPGQDNATPKIVQHTNIAYEMLAAIRTAKGLGTAILKVIIQELISAANADQIYITQTGNEVENNLDTVLDWSLTANLLPQFQGVNKKTLEMFEKIFIDSTGSPIEFFEEVNKDPSQLSEYLDAWKMFVGFVRNTDDVPEDGIAGMERVDEDESDLPCGELKPIASCVLMKVLHAARIAGYDLLHACQKLATKVTKWTQRRDKQLHRMMCYINNTIDWV